MKSFREEMELTLRGKVEFVYNCKSDTTGLPNTLSIGFRGLNVPSSKILKMCEDKGLIIAAGSACETGKLSHVLKECGVEEEVGGCTLRVSCGFWNDVGEGKRGGRILGEVVKGLKEDE